MGEATLIVLGAAAGGLAVAGLHEAVLGTPALARWLARAIDPVLRAGREGYAPSEEERRRISLVGTGALLLIALVIAGPGPLAILAAAGPATAGWVINHRRARYRRAVERRMPEIATAVADALAGGRSVRAALAATEESLEGPPAVEMARLAADIELGAPTTDALDGLRARLRSERVNAFATALLSQQAAGGDLATLMRRFAGAAADRDRVAEDARAATAQARFTGLLVVALPGGAALFAELIAPGFVRRVLADPAAVAMIGLAAALQVFGFWAIRRLGRVTE